MHGVAHGHDKVHSMPNGTRGLLQCLKEVFRQIKAIRETSGGEHPAEEVVDSIVEVLELKEFDAIISGSIAQTGDSHTDALVFKKCLSRYVRCLHEHCHDEDRPGTCVKRMKNELPAMINSPCRFKFHQVRMLELINSITCDQLGFVAGEHSQPFRSASMDYQLASLRYMTECFPNATTVDDFLHCQVEELTACFRYRRAAIHAYVSGRAMAMSISAMHAATNFADHYITQYAVKPMEQLQNPMRRYTMGVPPLEVKETKADNQRRAQCILKRLQYAKKNPSIECALYMHPVSETWMQIFDMQGRRRTTATKCLSSSVEPMDDDDDDH
jgi:hypothetical protein